MSMWRSGVVALLGASFLACVSAQVSRTLGAYTSYTPTATWAPAPVCSQGSNPALSPGGGVYQDEFGAYYEMQCGQQFSGTNYYDNTFAGTNAQGIGSCFYGCSKRPGCMGFTYTGTVVGTSYNWQGSSGRCYHFFNNTQGTLGPATQQLGGQNVYGAAYLLQASPDTICPFYDGQTFTDNWGVAYNVRCGYGAATTAGAGTVVRSTAVANVQSCLSACDAAGTASCNHAVYSHNFVAEPNPYRGGQANALCTFLTGTPTPTGDGTGKFAYVARAALPPVTTTTTALNTATLTPVSYNCPTDDGLTITENGQTYTIGCSKTAGGPNAAQYAASSSWNDCFLLCDAYPGCTAFTYEGEAYGADAGNCFLKTETGVGFQPSDIFHVAAVRAANLVTYTSTSSTAAPSYTKPAYACPANNGLRFTDSYGIGWVIACSADTNQGAYGTYGGTSYNDCFEQCATNAQLSNNNCTGFSYFSPNQANGNGPGTCFLKNFTPLRFMYVDDSFHVAAIRQQNYVAGTYDPIASFTTTTVSTSSSSLAAITTTSTTTTTSSSSSSSVPSTTRTTVSTLLRGFEANVLSLSKT
ncbi:hypothetical protein LTR37_002032 [Vermiconidia calcicola]|uniref:Uncharacterized protein n=1 Tax=Vermiconidia calcicola TaxID=1690605 RepID=A0ACC3NUC9_9PEZI|nr:hypothetical protein LTR37_002032 [Vermiconidia calcicola]